MLTALKVDNNAEPVAAGKLKRLPTFVFADFQTREHKLSHTGNTERVYVLTIKNEGSFCPVLNICTEKLSSRQILFDTFTDIPNEGTVEIQMLGDESTRIGIHEFTLSLRFLDRTKNIFTSQFTLENSVFAISAPQCIRRRGLIPKLLRFLSLS